MNTVVFIAENVYKSDSFNFRKWKIRVHYSIDIEYNEVLTCISPVSTNHLSHIKLW